VFKDVDSGYEYIHAHYAKRKHCVMDRIVFFFHIFHKFRYPSLMILVLHTDRMDCQDIIHNRQHYKTEIVLENSKDVYCYAENTNTFHCKLEE
jgi:hypothetical protein